MNLVPKLCWLFITLGLTLPALADLPTPYSSAQIVGKVERVTKLKVWGKQCMVIQLSNSSGFDRKASKSLFKILRRSGYDPARKTLRSGELAIVLPDKQARAIKKGDWIRVSDYFIAAHDNRTLATGGKSQSVTRIERPNQS